MSEEEYTSEEEPQEEEELQDEEELQEDEEPQEDEEIEEEDESQEEEEPQKEVSGWADAMSKILGSNKPKKKKQLILSRAKKDYEVRKPVAEKSRDTIEVVSTSAENENGEEDAQVEPKIVKVKKTPKVGANKRKKVDEEEDEEQMSLKRRRRLELKRKRLQKEWENLNRVRPDITKDKEAERNLMKIATKGVVELFNAVNIQKKTLGGRIRQAPRSEFKKDKILAEAKDLFEDAMDVVQKKRRSR